MSKIDNIQQPTATTKVVSPADQPIQEPAAKCVTCGNETSGYKCANCGEVSASHDPSHACGPDQCQPNCVSCDQAESKCICPPQQAAA